MVRDTKLWESNSYAVLFYSKQCDKLFKTII